MNRVGPHQVSLLADSALPDDWEAAWGSPSPFYRRQLVGLRGHLEFLARGIKTVDEQDTFGSLVAGIENEFAPIHRWFPYKEAFSPRLPVEIYSRLGSGTADHVADVFAGVGTTALSLMPNPRIGRVTGIEYSPLAHLVGATKLSWPTLEPRRLRRAAAKLIAFPIDRSVTIPSLNAFHNPQIFDPDITAALVSAREAIRQLPLDALERTFFLTGLAAIVEDVSHAMKDGRALRILRGRQRRRIGLVPREAIRWRGSPVHDALAAQWTAMIEDLEDLHFARPTNHQVAHIRGDARNLDADCMKAPLFQPGTVGLFLYSPPYLNFIDYSEVYKLELWLLELVNSAEQFRGLRLGTLRSHPSVEFPKRGYLEDLRDTPAADAIFDIATFISRASRRASSGRAVFNYFDDMAKVFQEQFRILCPGGWVACVVANSTFSRREALGDSLVELWRLPLLTDVVLCRLAEAVGFQQTQIWRARDLVARNVGRGLARESVVVFQKPSA